MTESVTLYEVGPRDGLQNESAMIATGDKILLVDRLSAAGFKHIEVSSFVSPKWVPQLADAADVFAGIDRRDGVVYSALAPNLKGLESALKSQIDEVAIFAAASESFSQKNINCSIAESLERFRPMMEQAQAAQLPVRGYISCITDCPYSGSVNPKQVAHLTTQLLSLGCYSVSLGDTLGKATPSSTKSCLDAVLAVAPAEQLAGHFHDTNGQALANVGVCLDKGLRTFDSAIGGLGGCPYAPGAKGNVATETLVGYFESEGINTGFDINELNDIGGFARALRAEHN